MCRNKSRKTSISFKYKKTFTKSTWFMSFILIHCSSTYDTFTLQFSVTSFHQETKTAHASYGVPAVRLLSHAPHIGQVAAQAPRCCRCRGKPGRSHRDPHGRPWTRWRSTTATTKRCLSAHYRLFISSSFRKPKFWVPATYHTFLSNKCLKRNKWLLTLMARKIYVTSTETHRTNV